MVLTPRPLLRLLESVSVLSSGAVRRGVRRREDARRHAGSSATVVSSAARAKKCGVHLSSAAVLGVGRALSVRASRLHGTLTPSVDHV